MAHTSEDHNPRIDYGKSQAPFVVSRFILECCGKLEAEALTTATAASLFHSFCRSSKNKGAYDLYLIAASSVYLASKVEEERDFRLRDVINVVHSSLRPEEEPLALGSEYYNYREAIVEAELLLLRVVDFKVKFSHPHKYLLHYLKALKDWVSPDLWKQYPLASTAWSLLQDFYHDPSLLEIQAPKTALACIFLSFQIYGVQVPFLPLDEEWIRVFHEGFSLKEIWEVARRITDVYDKDAELIEPIIIK